MEKFDHTTIYVRSGTGPVGAHLSESYKNFNLLVIKWGSSTSSSKTVATIEATTWETNERLGETSIYPSSSTVLESSGTNAIKEVIGIGRIN